MGKVNIYSSKATPSCGNRNGSRELFKTEVEIEGGQEEILEVLQVLERDGHQINGVLGKRTHETATLRGNRDN